MGQIHELIAVENDLKGKKKELISNVLEAERQTSLFEGSRKTVQFFDEERSSEEKTELNKVQCKIKDLITLLSLNLTNWYDFKLQKEKSNQEAQASIVIDEKILAENLPVTFLLGMEDELRELKSILVKIPTLSKSIDWKKLDDDTYQSETPIKRPKTEKKWMHKVMYDATDKFPAQIKEWSEDRPCGKTIEDKWSGMIPESEKQEYINKCEKLLKGIDISENHCY